MNITQLENQIIKAVDQEINIAGKVGINDNDYYDPNIELEELKQFIKKCFEVHHKIKNIERGNNERRVKKINK
jgi:hypothetical protein